MRQMTKYSVQSRSHVSSQLSPERLCTTASNATASKRARAWLPGPEVLACAAIQVPRSRSYWLELGLQGVRERGLGLALEYLEVVLGDCSDAGAHAVGEEEVCHGVLVRHGLVWTVQKGACDPW
jgi:hypothetical protein